MMFIHRDSMLQSALLLLILMLTWLSRAEFYRGRGLLDQRFDTSWVPALCWCWWRRSGSGFSCIAMSSIPISSGGNSHWMAMRRACCVPACWCW